MLFKLEIHILPISLQGKLVSDIQLRENAKYFIFFVSMPPSALNLIANLIKFDHMKHSFEIKNKISYSNLFPSEIKLSFLQQDNNIPLKPNPGAIFGGYNPHYNRRQKIRFQNALKWSEF